MPVSIVRKSTVNDAAELADVAGVDRGQGEYRFWSGVLPQPLQLFGESPAPEPAPATARATTTRGRRRGKRAVTDCASIEPEIVCPRPLFSKCVFT